MVLVLLHAQIHRMDMQNFCLERECLNGLPRALGCPLSSQNITPSKQPSLGGSKRALVCTTQAHGALSLKKTRYLEKILQHWLNLCCQGPQVSQAAPQPLQNK